jgi:predicted methyltransferase
MHQHRVCPWWLGYLLASPLRRLRHDPSPILAPYLREGMTVLEPGPGMGFFTLELARRVGPSGRVSEEEFEAEFEAAGRSRLEVEARPPMPHSAVAKISSSSTKAAQP